MKPANNIPQINLSKKEVKKAKKKVDELQKEMADSVFKTMKSAGRPLDLAEIIAAYPNNTRRKSCKNEQELKLYISMGIGKLIELGKIKELPQAEDGRFPLEIV